MSYLNGMKRLTIKILLIIPFFLCTSWGFYAHRRINQLAVFSLPLDMLPFFKKNLQYLTSHAVDPDKRRYIDTLEAPRHYLDVENYEKLIDSIPKHWTVAIKKYGATKMQQNGIIPWQIERSYQNLVKAFVSKDSLKILKYAADLGHYIGDAHVPLHTTHNHNGQLTNQHGIHGFWESRIPELFAAKYNLSVPRAQYLRDPLAEAWTILKQSNKAVDSVLHFEKLLSSQLPSDQKFSFSKRGKQVFKQYAEGYSARYQKLLDGMIEKRMRAAIHAVSSFWYSAWIDAGQPKLENFEKSQIQAEVQRESELIEKKFKEGKIIGREYK